jgi:uncharacterized protein YbjT (DUF2867 family)
MRILLTGANGYIGKRLLPVLLEAGHEVICCVRDKDRFVVKEQGRSQVSVLEMDFLTQPSADIALPLNIDAAYYLIHSLKTSVGEFGETEAIAAEHFKHLMETVGVKQVIYLGGLDNTENLSPHLRSRKNVGEILGTGSYALTILRAGIVIGSGSASFEIIRDLVEKLPVMVTPRWLLTRSQPIAVRNVIEYLSGVLMNERCMNRAFDIGGPDILTYKEMLLLFAEERGLKRWIFALPVMTPRLSSYWLYFVTSVSYTLAVNLVNSMKTEVICGENTIMSIIDIPLVTYREALRLAFDKIEQNDIVSSWKDAFSSGVISTRLSEHIAIPERGCFIDRRSISLSAGIESVVEKIWSIGGENGWYYGTWLWEVRGILDKFAGGVGLRRGRLHQHELNPGDPLDFWRVLFADKNGKRLALYAEMKLPGEAWLEFRIEDRDGMSMLVQTATFRPKGLFGRLYWYSLLPFHHFIFNGMMKKISLGVTSGGD